MCVRYVYPGVRFSQGKVAVLRAPKTTPIVGGGADSNAAAAAESAPATVTGADVVAALHRDGVDVQRWRPRVALRHAPEIGSPIPEADPSSGGDSAWRRRPVVPDFVGWRVLLDHDVVTFDADSVGLLVQLEDVLVSANTVPAGDHLSKFGDPFSRKGGGQNSRRRRRKSKAVNTDAPDDSSVTVDETAGLSDEPARLRAANYWRDDDTELLIEKSTKNAYAGAESDGVTVRPKEDTGAGFFGIGIVKAKHEQNTGRCGEARGNSAPGSCSPSPRGSNTKRATRRRRTSSCRCSSTTSGETLRKIRRTVRHLHTLCPYTIVL